MPSLQVQCPRCGQRATVDSALAGQVVGCPRCRQPFVVPAAVSQAGPVIAAQSPFGHRSSPRRQRRTSGCFLAMVGLLLTCFVLCAGILRWWASVVHNQAGVARQDGVASHHNSSTPARPTIKLAPPQFPIFANPQKVATILTIDGFKPQIHHGTNKIWNNTDNVEYFFITNEVEATPGRLQYVGDLANTVTYHGTSRVTNQVESVEFGLDVFNERMANEAVEAYKPMVGRFFQRLGLKMPNGLREAVDRRQPFSANEAYGKVQLKRDEHRQGFGFTLNLTIDVATEATSTE